LGVNWLYCALLLLTWLLLLLLVAAALLTKNYALRAPAQMASKSQHMA
jgi:hypothetical protein